MAIAHLRELIANGAKAGELLADPNMRELARDSPELQALVEEAARRNGE